MWHSGERAAILLFFRGRTKVSKAFPKNKSSFCFVAVTAKWVFASATFARGSARAPVFIALAVALATLGFAACALSGSGLRLC